MKQPIFLSLGSNYSFNFALLALRQQFWPRAHALSKAGKQIEQQLGSRPVFYYKGRDSIEQALIAVQRKHRQQLTVFTQAATCYAIEEAITRAGAQPVYVDTGTLQLNMTVQTLETAYRQAGEPRHAVVIVQHLLGFPAEIQSLRKWCNDHGLVLIEDLAQSYGAHYSMGEVVGTLADVVVGSFGRDKILDTVQGGFALVRKSQVAPQPKELPPTISSRQLVMDFLYPMTTWKIRKLHFIGLGKLLFVIAKRLGILQSPIPSPLPESSGLPLEYGALLRVRLDGLAAQLQHRRQVAAMYCSQLGAWAAALSVTEKECKLAACLRFPILVPDVLDFVEFLKKHRVYVSDRWYRTAVDMGSFSFPTVYQPGECPNAEFLTKHLCNLPTHQSLSMAAAVELARLVRLYLGKPNVLQWYSEKLGVKVHV